MGRVLGRASRAAARTLRGGHARGGRASDHLPSRPAPDDVLVDGSGESVRLDWDDVGPASPGRELGRLLADWHVHDGKPDAAAVRRTLAAYQVADGAGRIRDEQSFAMAIACPFNFLHSQSGVALDPDAAAEHRQHARAEVSDTVAPTATPELIAQLINLAAPFTG